MAGPRTRFTRKDYEAMPEDWRGELIEGDLVMSPAPTPYHAHLVARLLFRLRDHLGPRQEARVLLAPLDVSLDDDNVYQPDLLVLPPEFGTPGPDWKIPTPMWVVEILSPATAAHDRKKKLPRYARSGVREAWLVAPRRRQVEVHDLASGAVTVHDVGDTAASVGMPGFRLSLAEFFGG